jgi:hypothetical protein
MRRLLASLSAGVGATRHLIWYLTYQVTHETREPVGGLVDRHSSQGTAAE